MANEIQSNPQPLSIPPSQYWDGNDGRWSTFHLDVGTPAQLVRLLPGTSATAGDSIWVVLQEGCSIANPTLDDSVCANSRGNVFNKNASTTWSTSRLANDGLYGLDTVEEQKLGLTGNAYYGFETISLRDGLPTLERHPVAGIATNDFWLGSLGLSPHPINFTSLTEPVPSLLGRLRNSSAVASTSWAYHAGAAYKEPPVFGSLTFGGYDAARLQHFGLSLPFGADQSRDLLVGLQSITYDTLGSAPLMTEGIYAFIDSISTHMWLPLEVCGVFERMFGLEWDNRTELYLLNDTTHARLQDQNPTFTFTLGRASSNSSGDDGNVTTIVIPYSAFDLNVTQPFANTSTPYFPLKRAQNSTQYTLGRVFLQEAYVIADYDRRNFTIGQAAFPDASAEDLKAILPPGFTVEKHRQALGAGALAGIVVAVVAVAFIIFVLVWYYRRRQRARHATKSLVPEDSKAQPDVSLEELKVDSMVSEGASTQIFEADVYTRLGELSGEEIYPRAELFDSSLQSDHHRVYTSRSELPSVGVAAIEMEAPMIRAEMR